MNAPLKHTLAVLALSAALGAAPASAITTGSLAGDVQSAIAGSGQVSVTVTDGVATLTGTTDTLSKVAAGRAALASDGVDRVVNLIDAS